MFSVDLRTDSFALYSIKYFFCNRDGKFLLCCLTWRARVRSQDSSCDIRGGHSDTATIFSTDTLVFLVSIISPVLLTLLHPVALNQEYMGAKPGNLQRNKDVSKIGGHWIRIYFKIFCS